MQAARKRVSCGRAPARAGLAAFLVFILACGAARGFSTAPYFPLTTGATWTYLVGEGGPPTTVTRTVGSDDFWNGNPIKIVQDSDGAVTFYSNDAFGIRQHGGSEPNLFVPGVGNVWAIETDSPPQVLLNADATIGVPVTTSGTATITLSGAVSGTFPLNYTVTSTPTGFTVFGTGAIPGVSWNALTVSTVTRVFGTISGPGGNTNVDITENMLSYLGSGVGLLSAMIVTTTLIDGVSQGTVQGIVSLLSSNLIDSVPDSFSFTPVTGASPNAFVTSNTITVSGITVPAAISISGGQYSIDGGGYVNGPATITNGQTVTVQIFSSGALATQTSATLTLGGVSSTFQVTTQGPPGAPTNVTATAGNTQATITFTPPANNGSVITGYTVISSPGGITATGAAPPITITGLTNGQPYTFTVTATNTLGNGPASAPSNAVTPAVPDTTPNAFNFTARTGVGFSSSILSDAITVSGINTATPITVANGSYSVNGGAFTSNAGTVNNGDQLKVQVISSGSIDAQSCSTLTIGGVQGQFCVTTFTQSQLDILRILPLLLDD